MTITTKEAVRAAVAAALDGPCHGSINDAVLQAASALCLPVEAVHDALQPEGHCCQAGENLGVAVCEQCWGV